MGMEFHGRESCKWNHLGTPRDPWTISYVGEKLNNCYYFLYRERLWTYSPYDALLWTWIRKLWTLLQRRITSNRDHRRRVCPLINLGETMKLYCQKLFTREYRTNNLNTFTRVKFKIVSVLSLLKRSCQYIYTYSQDHLFTHTDRHRRRIHRRGPS